MFDIISIGAATVDFFVQTTDFKVSGQNLILPYSAKTEISKSLICSGGGATNTSVAFSRLGLKSACLSLIGQDPLRHYILQDLKQASVNSSLLKSTPDTTDYSVILVAPEGGRTILTNRGSSRLGPQDIDWDILKTSRWLYLTSLEGNLDLLEQLIGYALEYKIKISLNPGLRELKQSRLLIPLLRHVDFLLLNKIESEQLTGQEFGDSRFWDRLGSFGVPISAITNGRDGAYLISGEEKYYSPIINTHPVDETGAGDSFGSAFVAALIYHQTPQQALHWGIHNSASVVSHFGAKPGLLNYAQITT